MAEQDGLGLVFEQQGNTGAAAYNQPTLQMGQTPFDVLAERQRQDQLIKDKRDYAEKQRAEEQARAEQEAIKPIDLVGWEERDMQELGQIGDQLKTDWYNLKKEGVDPTDWSNPKALDYQKKYNEAMNKVGASKQHKAEYIAAVKELQANPDKYDIPKSVEALNALASGKITDRMGKPFATGLIPKAKVYDIQTPIKGLDIKDFTGSYEVDNPTSGKSGNYLRKKELRSTIEANIDNPVNADQVADALVKGDFKSKKEYADYLFEQASNRFSPKSSRTEKGDKGGFGGGGGLSEEQVTAIVNTPATQMNISETDVDGAVRKDAKGVTVSSKTTLYNPQSVGDLKLVVPSAAAYEIKKGKRGATSRNYTLKDGTLGVVLTYADGRPIHDLSGNENVYVFKNKDGKTVKLNEKDAINQGYLKYTTVLQGDGEYIDAGGDKKYEPIIVDANEYINTVNGKSSLPLNDAFNKLTVLNKVAEKKNGGATKTTTTTTVVPKGKVR